MSENTVVSSASRKNRVRKWVRRSLFRIDTSSRKVLMIMGAQRSGTTLLSRIFDDFYFADVYGEFSQLSSDDKYRLRLNSPEVVNAALDKSTADLIVMKPLVESQRAIFWLTNIANSKVVWLYRNYRDVASSSVAKFGNREGGISQARAFVDDDFARRDHAVWKSENASSETIETVRAFYDEMMSPHEAAALFWYARNRLFHEQSLQGRKDVILLKYEEFVKNPFLITAYLLNAVGIYQLESKTLSGIDNTPVGKGNRLKISGEIDDLCTKLTTELDACFFSSPLGKMLSAL